MQIVREFDIKYFDRKSVVTVGTFDGIHLGHRKIIDDLLRIRNQNNSRAVIVTFDPHPQIVLKNKSSAIRLLSTIDEKLELFGELGVDIVYLISFTEEFALTPAVDFYSNFLVDKVGLTDLVIGYDHTFGKDRQGNYDLLLSISSKYKFNVHRTSEFTINGDRIKSTYIRKLIEEGNLKQAGKLLGYEYSLKGKVVEGDRRGNTLGFPTANIGGLDEYKIIPKNGVYLVKVLISGKEFFGMMNIGYRPTVSDLNKIFLEVNIFDFKKDVYGKDIKVSFIERIRDEQKFGSIDDLITQLKTDRKNCTNKILKQI